MAYMIKEVMKFHNGTVESQGKLSPRYLRTRKYALAQRLIYTQRSNIHPEAV